MNTITPTQYVKACKPYLANGHSNGKVMPEGTFAKLDAAWRSFTPSQKTFCRMAISGPDKAHEGYSQAEAQRNKLRERV